MAGAVKLPIVDGGVNRRQNVRFLIPHHSPLYTLQDQYTDHPGLRAGPGINYRWRNYQKGNKRKCTTKRGTREEKLYIT